MPALILSMKGRVNGPTQKRFQPPFPEVIKTASVMLDYLKTERNFADYQLDRRDVETVSEARKSVERANDVITALEALDADLPRRTAVSGSIRSYINKITKH
jgi:hypothetical protein